MDKRKFSLDIMLTILLSIYGTKDKKIQQYILPGGQAVEYLVISCKQNVAQYSPISGAILISDSIFRRFPKSFVNFVVAHEYGHHKSPVWIKLLILPMIVTLWIGATALTFSLLFLIFQILFGLNVWDNILGLTKLGLFWSTVGVFCSWTIEISVTL